MYIFIYIYINRDGVWLEELYNVIYDKVQIYVRNLFYKQAHVLKSNV